MDNQYYFEQRSLLRESPANQADGYFTHDWETTNDQIDSFSNKLEGKIIAQMPDLGEDWTISDVRRSQQRSKNWLNRIYSGFVVISLLSKRLWQILPSIKFGIRQQKFYSNLIVICLIVLIIGGGVLIYKSSKKKGKETAHRDSGQNIVQIEKAETPKVTPPTTEKSETPSPKIPTATEKPATPSPKTPTATEKPATPSPKTPTATEKPATPPAVTAEKPATAVTVITSKDSDIKNKDQKNINSPWERSPTDNYSPWTMNTQNRLEEAAAVEPETPGNATTSMKSAPSVPNPSVPLVPMTPIVPNQPTIPTNMAVNNSTNNNVNPINNVAPNVNNPALPVNNSVYNNAPTANYPVSPPVSVAQRGIPYSSNANGIVTVYSQHNVPISQDYMATHERVNIPLDSAQQSTQPYNGQTLQNQLGQYPQIVPPTYSGTPTANNITIPAPMHGVAPQPLPVPMTGTAPPVQPVAPPMGTRALPIPQEIISSPAIPTGMLPPAGTMPMSQPIPTQVMTPIPPTYHYSPPASSPYHVPVANLPVSPSYYPPAVTGSYYQQGKTNTSVPYRRLY